MKIIEKSKMLDGTIIQIEDWQEDYSHIKTLEIGAYPKAKNTSKNGYIENNNTFRLSLINFKSNEEVKNVFEKLKGGITKLEDLQEHFYSVNDKFYLGLSNVELI